MNTIGIDRNLDRKRIRKLLIIGLFATVLTGIGDFLLGYGENTASGRFAASVMASAPSLTDSQMIAGGLFGFFGIFLEGLACFAIYRLMADAAPKYAHLYRAGIFGYIWLAPVGCHLNVGILNLAFKYLLQADGTLAAKAADRLFYGFSLPVYLLLVIFWLPMMMDCVVAGFNRKVAGQKRQVVICVDAVICRSNVHSDAVKDSGSLVAGLDAILSFI